jgi:hypothetical protein
MGMRTFAGRVLGCVALSLALAGVGAPARAAGATACRAHLTAYFAPGLSGTASVTGALRIAGSLTDCTGTDGAARGTATVSAGNVYTDANGYKWQEPPGTVSGTCINNTTAATTINRWSDGGISITRYTSNSATYGVALNGSNLASVTLDAVDKQAGQPDTLVVNATRDSGLTMAGLLGASSETDPAGSGQAAFTACSGGGLASSPLSGVEIVAG